MFGYLSLSGPKVWPNFPWSKGVRFKHQELWKHAPGIRIFTTWWRGRNPDVWLVDRFHIKPENETWNIFVAPIFLSYIITVTRTLLHDAGVWDLPSWPKDSRAQMDSCPSFPSHVSAANQRLQEGSAERLHPEFGTDMGAWDRLQMCHQGRLYPILISICQSNGSIKQ